MENFDWQGHRGARGELPENSIRAMHRALYNNATTLEMDVVITADSIPVLSHEPYMSSEICLTPGGAEIPESEEKTYNIYEMTLAEVRSFDCGSKKVERFPNQEKFATKKPALSEVIISSEQLALQINRPAPRYNIEIKSRPEWEGRFHPPVERYADLVVKEVMDANVQKRTTIQSFDPRALRYCHDKYPELELAYLTDDRQTPLDEQISNLGFTPDILSCHYAMVDQELMDYCSRKEMKVIPWTVNEISTAKRLVEMGVDGIITDYPSRLTKVKY